MTNPIDQAPTQLTSADWLPGYELLSVIGSGGFGTVYRARQLKLDRIVAVKVLRPGGQNRAAITARFGAESVVLAKLHHPNVVQVFDCGHSDDRLYLAMELLEGEDLGRRLLRSRPLGEGLAWGIARQVAAALDHATQHKVVHRDIKPTNIFLVPAPDDPSRPAGIPLVKVMDFGLAKWSVAPGAEQLTTAGVMLGTPIYMAPEQFREPGRVDHRADIYALGATLYHLLSGRPPFTGKSPWDVMAQKLERKPRLGATVSPKSSALVAAMMESDPAKRIASYEELIARIDELAALGIGAGRPQNQVWQRSRWAAAVAALGILVGTGIGAWASRGMRPEERINPANEERRGTSPEFITAGEELLLFDGKNLNSWIPLAGSSKLVSDEDKLKVLSWSGAVRRGFEPIDRYRLRIGIDLYEADAVELQFAIPEMPAQAPTFVLRVTKQEGAMLGARLDRGRFEARSPALRFSTRPGIDKAPYREVRIERGEGQWSVWFNNKQVGEMDDDARRLPELRLVSEGEGGARMDSALIVALKPK
jgi:serine/threonine protein kinase